MASNLCTIIIVLLFFTPHLYLCNFKDHLLAKLSRNRLAFHASRYYNKLRFGKIFEFHAITHKSEKIKFILDNNKTISVIQDGKKTPIILSSIPGKEVHLQQILDTYNTNDTGSLGIYTLNEPWECLSAGLLKLIKQYNIKHYLYPTIDMTAPSFIDLLRAVHDLEHRDQYGHNAAIIHCKAGRGRSATIVAAYLIHLAFHNQQHISIEQILSYIKKCRPQVRLSSQQKESLHFFSLKLQEAQSLANLYKQHEIKIKQREQTITQIFST